MMHTNHKIQVTSVCPVDGVTVDEYNVLIKPPVGTTLYAEAITKVVDHLTKTPITQEDLTQKLADLLGCVVESDGDHASGRVETWCRCYPASPTTIRPEDIRV